jgi:predicted dinucleotide-binding enzyme
MKVGILGSGMVGKALAKGFKDAGHDVRIGSRDGKKNADFAKESGVTEGTFADVASFAEIVVFALKGDAAEPMAKELAATLANKVVIDTTNPISGAPENGMLPYFTSANDSNIQRVQRAAPQAKVVKAFNSVGAGMMYKPQVKGGAPGMFICGDDAGAKATVSKLLEEFGWKTEDVGASAVGHAVEALCQLWCAQGFIKNDWARVYAVLRP